MGQYDGVIRINTRISTSDAKVQLRKLQSDLAKADKAVEASQKRLAENAKKLAEYQTERERIVSKTDAALARTNSGSWADMLTQSEQIQLEMLDKQYAGLLADQQQYKHELEAAKRTQEQITESVKEAQVTLNHAVEQVRMSEEAAKASKNLERSATRVGRKFLTWGTAMLAVRGVIGMLRKSVNAFLSDNENIANQLTSIWSAIGNALGPIIMRIIGLIQTLFAAVGAFIKALTGIDIVANYNAKALQNQADATAGAGAAAAKAERQLASFDEQNKLTDTSSSGGGGGGGGIEVPSLLDNIDNWLTDFATQLGLAFKDVFLDWSDLNGEDIAQKVITGLGALLGASVGFMIGGVPGAVVGTVLGVALSLVANAVLFDHDGVLSKTEVLQGILAVLWALAGGAVGFFIGGPVGAAIGITIGAGLSIFLNKTVFNWGGSGDPLAKLKAEVKDLEKTFKNADSTFESTSESVYKSASAAEYYVGRLEELEAAGLDTEEAQLKYKAVVDLLNETIPNLNAQIDEETGLVKGGTSAIRDQISAWRELAIQQAYMDVYSEKVRAVVDAEMEVAEAQSELNRLQSEGKALTNDYESALSRAAEAQAYYATEEGRANSTMLERYNTLSALSLVVQKSKEAMDENAVAQANLSSVIESGTEKVNTYKDALAINEQAMTEYMNTTATTSAGVETSVADMATNATQSVEDMKTESSNSFATMNTAASNDAKKMSERTSSSMRQMRSNISAEAGTMESDVSGAWAAIQNSFSNWSSFWEGLGKKLRSTFTDIGVSLGSAISGAVKSAINGVISRIQSTMNSAVSIINGAIGVINLLPGVSASYLSYVSLPRLAKGGIVNNPGMGVTAVIGEAGAEAVLPLERNTGWMDILADKLASRINGGNGQIVLQNYMNSRRISEEIINYQQRRAFAMNKA